MSWLKPSIVFIVLLAVLWWTEQQAESDNRTVAGTNLTTPSQVGKIKDYRHVRSVFWKHIYAKGGETLYCRQKFGSSYEKGLNIEHVFPMSWVTNSLDCGTRTQCRKKDRRFNQIEADLHNLFPAKTDVNQARSSFAFGEVSGEKRWYGQHCDFEIDAHRRLAEPPNIARGEVARAMFYMADRYQKDGLILFDKQIQVLSQWHLSDPPSPNEKTRNDLIENVQGNRNPFVDDPSELTKLVNSGRFNR